MYLALRTRVIIGVACLSSMPLKTSSGQSRRKLARAHARDCLIAPGQMLYSQCRARQRSIGPRIYYELPNSCRNHVVSGGSPRGRITVPGLSRNARARSAHRNQRRVICAGFICAEHTRTLRYTAGSNPATFPLPPPPLAPLPGGSGKRKRGKARAIRSAKLPLLSANYLRKDLPLPRLTRKKKNRESIFQRGTTRGDSVSARDPETVHEFRPRNYYRCRARCEHTRTRTRTRTRTDGRTCALDETTLRARARARRVHLRTCLDARLLGGRGSGAGRGGGGGGGAGARRETRVTRRRRRRRYACGGGSVTLVPARNQVTCIKLTYIPLSFVLSSLIKHLLAARLCR